VERPVALYCPPSHQRALEQFGIDTLFEIIGDLPEPHCSIIGFKHNLHKYMPFERSLFVDADMVWCRNPDALWKQLAAYRFTTTGVERSDFFFGGPKGVSVIMDLVTDRRRTTMRRFGLTNLQRVQAGMIYSSDIGLTEKVCDTASYYLSKREQTHFRSRLTEGRSEESCEWSLAMAMSQLQLQVVPWFQGYQSPQLDFIEGLTTCDSEFENVICRYYSDRFVYSMRGLPDRKKRDRLMRFFSKLPGRGDYIDVTPFALHFGWLIYKKPFYEFSERTWARITEKRIREPLPVE